MKDAKTSKKEGLGFITIKVRPIFYEFLKMIGKEGIDFKLKTKKDDKNHGKIQKKIIEESNVKE